MFKNKKNLIIAGLLAVLIIIAIIALISVKRKQTNSSLGTAPAQRAGLPAPQFLTVAEKKNFRISPDLQVQVLQRSASGSVTVYKIIKNSSDIILDPSKIAPLSPFPANPGK